MDPADWQLVKMITVAIAAGLLIVGVMIFIISKGQEFESKQSCEYFHNRIARDIPARCVAYYSKVK